MSVFVKSKTDVITNSSTEVFIYYPSDAIERIQSLIQSILDMSGSDQKASDLFDITLIPGYKTEDDFKDALKKGETNYPDTDEGIMAWVKDTDYDPGENWSCVPYPTWTGVKILPKKNDPALVKIAANLMYVLRMCSYEGFYNG